jgi:hypothetical protein
LAVEHIRKGDHVVWHGEYGETYFFQCELPYHENGFKAYGYSVARSVQNHAALGVGVYIIGKTAKVKSGVLLPPSAKADHVFNIVIGGGKDQFQYVACAYGEDAQNEASETCYGPSCWGRCFVDAVPRRKPLDIKLPKAKKTKKESQEPRLPTEPERKHRNLVRPPHAHPVTLPSVPTWSPTIPPSPLHSFYQTTPLHAEEPKVRNHVATCGEVATWASRPGCALQSGIGFVFLIATVVLIIVTNNICATRTANDGTRMALIPSQSEKYHTAFTNLPTTPYDDDETAHDTAILISTSPTPPDREPSGPAG